MKLALALIIKGDDKEAIVFARLLSNLSKYVDRIFVTITHKKDEQINEKVKQVAESFGAEISTFEWVKNFAKARNFSFSQVPKDYDYIMWADADDVFRGIENLRDILDKNQDKDAFAMNYLYAFDKYKNPIIVHKKTMIVKNDNCVEWSGSLHEDFKENRNINIYFLKDIERLHLTDDDRVIVAKERNVECAKQGLEDKPNDPRSYWNLAQSLHGLGKFEESNKLFDEFLKLSYSDDEKYIARLRKAENFWYLGDISKALDESRYAVGTKPNYPDAYYLLGKFYAESQQYNNAIEAYVSGLVKKPPYYSIIVYNPRDYDYNPMMNLANVYFKINRADMALPLLEGCAKIYPKDKRLKETIKFIKKEAKRVTESIKAIAYLKDINDEDKLKEEIAKLPKDIQSHPHICFLRNNKIVKKESSGKDLVIFCGYTEEIWSPETARLKGIGGSEEAVIHLAKRWQKAGYNVTVYNRCGHEELEFDGVKYKPEWAWNFRDKQDITILWRTPKWADYDINSTKIFVDLHDVIPDGEFNEKRLAKIDKVFVKTEFHKTLFPSISQDKFVVIPNGIDSSIFEQNLERDEKLIINTSSPDRSLSGFLDIIEEVKKEIPDIQAKWAYGWGVFDSVHGENTTVMEWKAKQEKKMKELGVENLGRISHEEVAKLYLTAGVFLYPTEFAEIHCISAVKAQAGGAYPITTDFAALDETVQYGDKIHSEKTKDNWCENYQYDFSIKDKKEFIEKLIYKLKNPIDSKKEEMRKWARETYNWDLIASKWLNEF